jgi:hypothetical protein
LNPLTQITGFRKMSLHCDKAAVFNRSPFIVLSHSYCEVSSTSSFPSHFSAKEKRAHLAPARAELVLLLQADSKIAFIVCCCY